MDPEAQDFQEWDELTDEEPSSVTGYSWWTILLALILALSLLGSFIWRAFPPSTILERAQGARRGIATPDLPLSLPVAASAGWVDTGLDLSPGGYRIRALGRVALDQATPENEYLGPEGGLSRCRPAEGRLCALSGAPYGALIGRIDDGEPFKVGAVIVIEVAGAGRLQLAVNDRSGDYRDNHGSFTVRIERFDSGGFETASRLPLTQH